MPIVMPQEDIQTIGSAIFKPIPNKLPHTKNFPLRSGTITRWFKIPKAPPINKIQSHLTCPHRAFSILKVQIAHMLVNFDLFQSSKSRRSNPPSFFTTHKSFQATSQFHSSSYFPSKEFPKDGFKVSSCHD